MAIDEGRSRRLDESADCAVVAVSTGRRFGRYPVVVSWLTSAPTTATTLAMAQPGWKLFLGATVSTCRIACELHFVQEHRVETRLIPTGCNS